MSILFYSLGFSLTCKHHGRKVENGAQEEARRREEEEEARRREKGGGRGSEEKREGKRGKSRVHADGPIEEENPIFCFALC